MRLQHFFLIACASLYIATGCSNDSTTGGNTDLNGLGIMLHRTSTEDVEILMVTRAEEDVRIQFCYEGEGCDSGYSGTMSWSGPTSIYIETSEAGKKAIGVIVGFQFGSGAGYVEVLEGASYEDDEGWSNFDEGDVIYTSDPFSEGDIVSFTVGVTE